MPVIPVPVKQLLTPPAILAAHALFLHVDGCLVDLQDEPDQVRAGDRLLGVLDTLVARLDGAVALVSGRSLASLRAVFGGSSYRAVGLHGLEWDGEAASTDQAGAISEAAAKAQVELARHPGAFVEDKGVAIALHWRTAPEAAPFAEALARKLLPGLPGFRLQYGKDVIELRPAGTDKGTAIQRLLLSPPFAGRSPVFAGDDLTDEEGFQVVNALGGISVRVGDRLPTRARFSLPGPTEVLNWLENVQ